MQLFNVDEAEERVCKQAGECILLLSKWRSENGGLSICLYAGLQSRPERYFKCFMKFLLRRERWETFEEQPKSSACLEVVRSHQRAHCARRLGIQSSQVKIPGREWTQGVVLSCGSVWCVTWC